MTPEELLRAIQATKEALDSLDYLTSFSEGIGAKNKVKKKLAKQYYHLLIQLPNHV
ncbi:hypothetical protein Q5H92_14660 [Hymenobacter sp. M29]|uniref:Uncharacterized protein n=1 Tax=Hymenobacter mellowenesis TaxID=3063995 RepID=A0ABT9ADW5_9BACT|nr:hypothetical protein [Hymenobacter sp. M29]MDO7847607.1 hypothetical protein [Hymenobacter sp. M29]